jgi:glycosyltransferase involved in cell wall biosynthesis
VGVDWIRKAGDFAISIAELLNRQGLPTELNIVGCTPPREVPSYVKVHGFLSKANDLGARRLRRLFSECHFLLHPSRAECFGLALAEASAFALPSLAAHVGGTASVVADGVNGRLFSLEDPADAYCAYIRTLFASRDEYLRAAAAAYREYAERLNWTVAGRRVCELIGEAIPTMREMAVSIAP